MSNGKPETSLNLRRLGIDTFQEPVLYMRADCDVCRAEGFASQSRVRVMAGDHSIIATLGVVTSSLLAKHEAGVSEAAWAALGAREGDTITVTHVEPVESFSSVRAKVYGHPLSPVQLRAIISDVANLRYSRVEMAAFITACANDRLSVDETTALTMAMVDVGTHLHWPHDVVVDKHCVGGLPGNRTTPIVVAIVAACGLVIPKTSSRAITSPAGTADTMETLAPVALDLPAMRRVVEQEGGCIVWGGAMGLSPADDILIRVERPLDFDSEGQLVASILSKKIAAGSTHLLVDIPVGPSAKVRSAAAAASLEQRLVTVGSLLGLTVRIVQTDGSQPVGRGIGPALEAMDILAVLQNRPGAPADLADRAVRLAGALLELGSKAAAGCGYGHARQALTDGRAWKKFQAICEAQGGLREPVLAPYQHVIASKAAGIVSSIDNRRLSRIAKLAGAPGTAAAGLSMQVSLHERVAAGQPLYTLHAGSPGELAYALRYVDAHADAVSLETPS
jgi:thymidine phosphorylase